MQESLIGIFIGRNLVNYSRLCKEKEQEDPVRNKVEWQGISREKADR